MKKRLLALTLVLVLSLSIAIPGFAAPAVSDFSGWTVVATGTSVGSPTSVDSTLRMAATVGYAYAVVKAADVSDTSTKKITWKPIKASDVGLDGKMDVTKLLNVTESTYLLFYANSKDAAAIAVPTGKEVNTGAEKMTGILIPKASKWKIDSAGKKPTYSFTAAGQAATFSKYVAAASATTLEYAPVNSTNWIPFTGEVPVMPYKQDFNVREAATSGTNAQAPSVVSKISIAALTVAPTVKFDAAKGTAKLKKDMEYSFDGGKTFAKTGTSGLTLEMGKSYTIEGVSTTIDAKTTISYRTAATDKKPGSDWATGTFLGSLRPAATLTADMFCITAKGIEVVGSIPVQALVNDKWKNTKVFKNIDLTDGKIFDVRLTGSKTSAAGATYVLTYNKGTFSVALKTAVATATSL